MTITTKFDVGQIVWIMFNNEPETWKVRNIHIGDVTSCSPMITYKLTHHGDNHTGSIHEITEMEHKIFASKRELCLSFLTDKD